MMPSEKQGLLGDKLKLEWRQKKRKRNWLRGCILIVLLVIKYGGSNSINLTLCHNQLYQSSLTRIPVYNGHHPVEETSKLEALKHHLWTGWCILWLLQKKRIVVGVFLQRPCVSLNQDGWTSWPGGCRNNTVTINLARWSIRSSWSYSRSSICCSSVLLDRNPLIFSVSINALNINGFRSKRTELQHMLTIISTSWPVDRRREVTPRPGSRG